MKISSVNHKRFNEIRDIELPLSNGKKKVGKKDFAGQINTEGFDGDDAGHQ
jgi:hypothetical protein